MSAASLTKRSVLICSVRVSYSGITPCAASRETWSCEWA